MASCEQLQLPHAGVVKGLAEQHNLQRYSMIGSSSGAVVATLAACGVDPHTAIDSVLGLVHKLGRWLTAIMVWSDNWV